MRRLVPALAIPILMGVPIYIQTSWIVGLLALLSAALCILAVLRSSTPLGVAGGAFALISLALALRGSPSSINMLTTLVFGLALLLLIDGIHLNSRFAGAAIAQVLWRRYLAWWGARAAVSLGVALIVATLASLVAILVPPLWKPFLVGIGILATFISAMTFAWPTTDR